MIHSLVIENETLGEFCSRNGLTRAEFFAMNRLPEERLVWLVDGTPSAYLEPGERLVVDDSEAMVVRQHREINAATTSIECSCTGTAVLSALFGAALAVAGMWFVKDDSKRAAEAKAKEAAARGWERTKSVGRGAMEGARGGYERPLAA